MKKGKTVLAFISTVLLASLCVIIVSSLRSKINNDTVSINVYNWGEYISDGTNGTLDVNAEFTKKTGIKVNYTTYQSNEALFAKLQSGATKYDVIIPSDYMIAKMIDNNMLKKLNFSNIPNYALIDKEFKNTLYDPKNEYSVPYTWGRIGIFYNKKMVDEKPENISWDILWNEKYKNNILMFDNPRDAFAIAQIKLGLSINSTNEEDWNKAADELKKQKPLVQSYVMDQIFDKMGNEEAAVAPYYSGDSYMLMNRNNNIGFVIPKEGTNKFVDAMCVPANSEHQNEAEAYINFMCDKTIATENIKYIGYSSPESCVKENLDPQIANNSIYYPTDSELNNAQFFTSLPDEINKLMDELWIIVKIGEPSSPLGLILVLTAFLLVYILTVIYNKKRHLVKNSNWRNLIGKFNK